MLPLALPGWRGLAFGSEGSGQLHAAGAIAGVELVEALYEGSRLGAGADLWLEYAELGGVGTLKARQDDASLGVHPARLSQLVE